MGPKDLDPYKMQNLVNQYPCESFEPFEMGKLIFFFSLSWVEWGLEENDTS